MASLIMRLKLFWTPQMCLALSILAQPVRLEQFFQWVTQRVGKLGLQTSTNQLANAKPKTLPIRPNLVGHLILGLVLAHMAYYGMEHLQEEWSIQGSFASYHQEVLVSWLRSLPAARRPQTTRSPDPPAWVLSGPLAAMGSLRLLLPAPTPYPTPQPIEPGQSGFAFTNHPHYENAELRQRTILASSIYGRQSVSNVWHIYRNQLKTDFVLVEVHDCAPRQGCSKPELLDLVYPDLVNRPALCEFLMPAQVMQQGQTPDQLKPYFSVVYVEPSTGRIILHVNKP